MIIKHFLIALCLFSCSTEKNNLHIRNKLLYYNDEVITKTEPTFGFRYMVKPGMNSLREPYTKYLSSNPKDWPRDLLEINDYIGLGYITFPETTQEPDKTPIPHIYWMMDNYKMYIMDGPFYCENGKVYGSKLRFVESGWLGPKREPLKVDADGMLRFKNKTIALSGKASVVDGIIIPSTEELKNLPDFHLNTADLPMITSIGWLNERLGMGYSLKNFRGYDYIVYWPLKNNVILFAKGPFYIREDRTVVSRGLYKIKIPANDLKTK